MNARLKRHFSIVHHSPNVVELRHGVWNPTSFTVTDETSSGRLGALLKRLDGSTSATDIADGEGIPRADVDALITRLSQMGVLETGPGSAFDHYVDDLVPLLRDPQAPRPDPPPILILGDSPAAEDVARILGGSHPGLHLERALMEDPAWTPLTDDSDGPSHGLGFGRRLRAFESWKGRFLILADRTVHPVRARALNRVCLALGIPWIHAAIDGPYLLVGPTFLPRRSPCYECLDQRILMGMRGAESYARYKEALARGAVQSPEVALPRVLHSLLASHVAMEALNLVATGTTFTVGKLLTIFLPTMEFTFHDLLRLPGCTACGSLPERDDRQLYFETRALLGR